MAFGSSSTVAKAVGIIEADTSRWKKGLREAEGDLKASTSRMSTMGKAAGVAGAAGLGLLAVGATKAVKAYQDAEISQAKMTAQLKASGISYEKYSKQIDDTIKKQSQLSAFDDEDLQDSFTNLVRTTGDVTEALKLNGLAADIARAKGMSLEAASKLLQKAYMGSAGAAKKLGIDIAPVTTAQDKLKESTKHATDEQIAAAKAADKTATQQTILAKLQGTFAGQAEAYGNSGAGAAEKIGVATENLQEAMGSLLAPVVERVANLLAGLAGWAERNKTAFAILVGAFAAVSASLVAFSIITKIVEMFKALAIVTKLVTAAQWLLNIAMDANPIGLVIIAIAALVAAFVIAYKHSETFRAIVDKLWGAMQVAFNWIKDHWKLLAAIIGGPVVAIILFRDKIVQAMTAVKNAIVNAFNAAKNAVTSAASWIKGKASDIVGFVKDIPGKIGDVGSKIWGKLKGGWNDVKNFVQDKVGVVVGFITGIPGKIGDIGGAIGRALVGGIRTVWNAAVGVINKGIDAFNFLPGPDIGHLPTLQHGGLIGLYPGTSYGVDGVPAMVAPGEAVMTTIHQARAAAAAGLSPDEWRRAVGLRRVTVGGPMAKGGYYFPTSPRGSLGGGPGGGTHSRTENGYIWQDDDAWDIMVPHGTNIVAVGAGSLGHSSYGGPGSSRYGGYGVHLYLDGGGDVFYKHMVSSRVSGHVAAGEAFAKSGEGAGVPHLHIGFNPLSIGYAAIGGSTASPAALLWDKEAHDKWAVKHGRYESEVKKGKAFKWGGYYFGKAIGHGKEAFEKWWKWKNGGKLTGLDAWKKKFDEAAWLLDHETPKVKPKPPKPKPPGGGQDGGGGGGGADQISDDDTTPEMTDTTQAQVDALIQAGGYVAGVNAPTYDEFKVMVSGAKKDKDNRTADEKRLFDKYSDWRQSMKDSGVEWWKKQYPSLGISVVAPIADQPTAPPGPVDGGTDDTEGTDTGGSTGGDTGAGGGDSGPTAAEIEAQIQERIKAEANAVWSARQGFYTDLGSNIFSPGPGGMTMGSTAGAAGVTVVQNFNRQPEDQFANMKRAERAAAAAFGK
jgi:hypothetical protein